MLDDHGRLPILPFDLRAAGRFAEWRRRHGAADLKFAATVLIAGGKLLTRNVRDFEGINGLAVENLVAPPRASRPGV